MGGQHVLEQGRARAGEAHQEHVELGIARPGSGFGRAAPSCGVGGLEPGPQPRGRSQGALAAGRFVDGCVQAAHFLVGGAVGLERLRRLPSGVPQVPDQAEHDRPVGRRQARVPLQLVQEP